jgi:sugar fermentation stimulation protein A
MNSGCYIVVFRLDRPRRIRVGRLGMFEFAAGYYLYVGSAQRNLAARLERHARKRKPMRWHIDYLSSKATMIGALLCPGSKERECELAAELGGMLDAPVPRFGASDCRCPAHLFYTTELP